MAGRQALPAAMLVALAVGCVVIAMPGSASAQTAAQSNRTTSNPNTANPNTAGPNTNAPASNANVSTPNPLGGPATIATPSPLLNNIPLSAASVIQRQDNATNIDFQQQGVAIPQRPASQPRNVAVSLASSVLYDTNSARANRQRTQTAGLSRSDFTFPLSVLLDIYIPSGANRFSLGGNVGYNFHLRNTQRNGENIGLTAGYQRQFQPCSVALGTTYQRSRSQLGNNGLVVLPVRNIQTRTSGSLSLSCGSIGGARPFVSGNFSQARNSDQLRKISDSDTRSYGAGVTVGQAGFIEVGLVGSIDDTNYPNRGSSSIFRTTGFKAKSIGILVNRAAARRLQARVQLNYTSVSSQGGPSFKGLSGQAYVTFIPGGGRFVVNASASRATNPSLSTAADYQLVTIGSLGVSAVVTSKTHVSMGFTNQRRRYLATFFDPVHPLMNDTLRSIDFSAGYRANAKLSFNATAAYDSRRANDPFFNFSGARFAISASLNL